MGKRKKTDPNLDQNPDLTAEVCEELLHRVKETAQKIEGRVKKARKVGEPEVSDDTGETAKLETEEGPSLPPMNP
jgi:hypothetical protein